MYCALWHQCPCWPPPEVVPLGVARQVWQGTTSAATRPAPGPSRTRAGQRLSSSVLGLPCLRVLHRGPYPRDMSGRRYSLKAVRERSNEPFSEPRGVAGDDLCRDEPSRPLMSPSRRSAPLVCGVGAPMPDGVAGGAISPIPRICPEGQYTGSMRSDNAPTSLSLKPRTQTVAPYD